MAPRRPRFNPVEDRDPRTVRDYDPVRAHRELTEAADERLKAALFAFQAASAMDPSDEDRPDQLAQARIELRDAREVVKNIRIFGPDK